jgi:hypothetical protein
MRDFLPFLAKPAIAATTLVAHRIVRCDLPTVGEVYVSPVDRTADSPDCPVCTEQPDELLKKEVSRYFAKCSTHQNSAFAECNDHNT